MFELRWLKRFIRRRTKPIPAQKAIDWKRRLSIIYAISSWHAFGLVLYMCYSGHADWMKSGGFKTEEDLSPARQYARILGVENAKVYRVSGFSVKGTYEINAGDSIQDDQSTEMIVEDAEVLTEVE